PALRIIAVAAALVLASAAGAKAYTSRSTGHGRPARPFGVPAAPACDYKIAVLGGLNDVTGKAMLDGAKLAVEQYNAAHPRCTVGLTEFDTFNPANKSYDR